MGPIENRFAFLFVMFYCYSTSTSPLTTRVKRIFFYTLGATFPRYYTEDGRASSGIRDPTLDGGRCATKTSQLLIALKKKTADR